MRPIPCAAALLILASCGEASLSPPHGPVAVAASDPEPQILRGPQGNGNSPAVPPGHDGRAVVVTRILVVSEALAVHGHTLAAQFERMTGRTYPVEVGTAAEAGDLYLVVDEGETAPDYEIRQMNRYVRMRVAPRFAGRATWRLLRHLGYRQFMPGDVWEHVPALDAITFEGTIEARDSFVNVNNLGTAGNPYLVARPLIDEWLVRNGVDTLVPADVGHAWQALIRDHDELQDPKYHTDQKLNVLEPLVQEKALQWTKGRADAQPDYGVWSMTPSDGSSGWDRSTTGEHLLYNPSDRALLLANHVQQGLRAAPGYDHLRVGLYAYAETSRTPTVQVDPGLLIGVADGFYQNGQNFEKVLADYRALGATSFFGYFYWEVYQWSWDEPGKALMSDRTRWGRMAERAFGLPVTSPRILNGESGSSWGSTAQGSYALIRALDRGGQIGDPAAFFDESVAEMVEALFPNVTSQVTDYFDLVTARGRVPLLSSHFVHHAYQALIAAMEAPGATDVERARLAELLKYVHYLDLRVVLAGQPPYSEAQLDAFEDMVAWAWAIRMSCLVNWRAITRRQPAKWSHLWSELEDRHGTSLTTVTIDRLQPWGPTPDPDPDTMLALARARAEVHPTYPFEPVSWGEDPLALVTVTDADPRARGSAGYFRPDLAPGTEWFFATAPGHDTITWDVRAGLVYGRAMTLQIIRMSGGLDEVVQEWIVPGDSPNWHTITATVEPEEVYRLHLFGHERANEGIQINWWAHDGTGATRFTVKQEIGGYSSPFIPSTTWYFYVPKGTEVIGGYWTGDNARLIDPSGATVLQIEPGGTRVFQHAIANPSHTGNLWRLQGINGPSALLTVPPYLAQHPTELLVPGDAAPGD